MSIDRNLGNAERIIRLCLGIWLMVLAFTTPGLNGIEWFIGLVSTFLILNGIFSRCYLWYVLDINTYDDVDRHCSENSQA